jgi:hypothetical protein
MKTTGSAVSMRVSTGIRPPESPYAALTVGDGATGSCEPLVSLGVGLELADGVGLGVVGRVGTEGLGAGFTVRWLCRELGDATT